MLKQLAVHLAADKTWVVGGAVRNLLLGQPVQEIDLVTVTSPKLLPLAAWQKDGVHVFWLDQERQILRLLPMQGLAVDIAPLQGGSIDADLRQRDFTINAMAVPLADWLVGRYDLIDPMGGQMDIEQRCLRLVSPQACLIDPVRILRGVRFSVEMALTFAQPTVVAMRLAAPRLSSAAGERILAELSRILLSPQAVSGCDHMASLGVDKILFPELDAMRGMTQNKYHQFTVDVHTRKAFAAFVAIVHKDKYLPLKAVPWWRSYWSELQPSLQAAAMLAAWLHDIGKPPTRAWREQRVTFYGHEQVGAQMIGNVAARLKMSREQTALMQRFVRLHMYPMQLWRTGNFNMRLAHRLFRRTGEYGPLIVVFSLADHLAKGDDRAETDAFDEHQRWVEYLLEVYFCRPGQINPSPLLDGHEIAEVAGCAPGRWIGEVKDALLEQQVLGRVQTLEQAVAFVQQMASHSDNRGVWRK